MNVEGIGWKVMEQSREKICQTVSDAAANRDALSEADRLSCQARCLMEAQVRCPTSGE